jgi:hypothetical protein
VCWSDCDESFTFLVLVTGVAEKLLGGITRNNRTRPRDVIMYSCILLYPTIEYRVLRGSCCNIYKGLIIVIHLRAAAAAGGGSRQSKEIEVVQTLLLSGWGKFRVWRWRNLSCFPFDSQYLLCDIITFDCCWQWEKRATRQLKVFSRRLPSSFSWSLLGLGLG